jgi:hypothetical protein
MKITYYRINVFFAIVTGINVMGVFVSRMLWPSLSSFPQLLPGHPVLSLLVYGVFIAFGLVIRIRLKGRSQGGKIDMVVYALTLGIALCAVFTVVGLTLSSHFTK